MKSVVVTGASRGIGREIAKQFAAENYYVIINYNRNKAKAESLLCEIKNAGGCGDVFKANVSLEKEVASLMDFAKSRCGKIDVLVNNAGICEHKLFMDITLQNWQNMFDINVASAFLCSKYALKQMLLKKSGAIINISSIWGITGASCEVHYSASKAAVIGLTKALAKEVGLSGITVNCIAPGVIQTDMLCGLNSDEIECLKEQAATGTLGKVEDVAALAVFLASEKASFITGQVISPNGGMVI